MGHTTARYGFTAQTTRTAVLTGFNQVEPEDFAAMRNPAPSRHCCSRVAHPRNVRRAPFAPFLELADRLQHGFFAGLEDSICRIAQSVSFTEDIQHLIRDRWALTQLTKRSYVHGNGFVKLELAQHYRSKLRLHVWFPDAEAREDIHDHRWTFASCVLAGTLCSEEFVDDPNGTVACHEYRYTSRSKIHAPVKELVRASRLTCVDRTLRPVGTSYVMRPGELHRIFSSNQSLVATLMITTPPVEDGSRLLVERNSQIEPAVASEALKPSTTIKTLEAVLALEGEPQ